MELIVEVGVGVLVSVLLGVAVTVWRVNQVVSWRSLAMVARATGSFEECVAFIRYCAQQEHGSEVKEIGYFARQRGISSSRWLRRSLDEIPHASP